MRKTNCKGCRAAATTSAEAGLDCASTGNPCGKPPLDSFAKWRRWWRRILRCTPTTAGTNLTLEPAWSHRFSPAIEEVLFCYCPRTIGEFQRWLERRYGSLDRLNQAWVR